MSTIKVRFWKALPQLRVVDFADSVRFYEEKLGFRADSADDPPAFTHLERGGVVLQMGRARSAETATRADPVGYNLYVFVDDVVALAQEYRDRAVSVEGPVDRRYGCREIIVEDNAGLRLCFAQDLAPGSGGPVRSC